MLFEEGPEGKSGTIEVPLRHPIELLALLVESFGQFHPRTGED
jgi:hypothetical protein